MGEKGFVPVLVLIIVSFVVTVIGVIYYFQFKPKPSTQLQLTKATQKITPSPIPTPLTKGKTADLKSYKNYQFQFSLKYPPEWGDAYYLENLKQVRIGNDQPYKILINIESFEKKTAPEIRNELAEIVQDLECRIDLRTIRSLGNNNYAFIYFTPSEQINQEECNKIWNSLTQSRIINKESIPHVYKIAWLNGEEIPNELKEDYSQFKSFLTHFRTNI